LVSNAAVYATNVTGASQGNITSLGTMNNITMGSANSISGGNLLSATYLTGTLTTAAQPNITSVGTLTSLNVTGNINGANIIGNHYGNGSALSSITGANVTGTLSVPTTSYAATVSSAAQPNITSVGTLSGLTVTGTISGNINGYAATVSSVAQPNITSVGTLTSLNVSGNANVGNIGAGTGVFTAGITDVSGTGYALRVVNPGGASYATSTSAVTGAIKITLPQGFTNTMMRMTVTVYTYDGQAFEINLGGYNYLPSSGWYSTFADITTNSRPALNVRFGFDGTYCCIYIGETSTVWSYPQVFVTEFQAGYSNYAASQWNTGWSVSFATTLLNVTSTVNTASMVLYANGSGLTSLTGSNVTGQVGYAAVANSVAGANVSGAVAYATTANAVAGANVSGTVANATYATSAGSATVASSANSVAGANVSGQVSYAATANAVAGANVSGQVGYAAVANSVAGSNVTGTVSQATTVMGNTQNNINTLNNITIINAGANTTAGTITGNWALSAGSKLTATYADLGEYYSSDSNYEPGTVLMFGGINEVTMAEDGTNRIAGVVSTNPAYVMNSGINAEYPVVLALQGRVPCKVRGKITKGDMLISGGNGYARPSSSPLIGTVIGKALADYNGNDGIIEIAVGRL